MSDESKHPKIALILKILGVVTVVLAIVLQITELFKDDSKSADELSNDKPVTINGNITIYRGKKFEEISKSAGKVSIDNFSFALENNEKKIPVSFDIFTYYKDSKGRYKDLSNGARLNSGDEYYIYLKPSVKMFLYAFQIDEGGSVFQLFPNSIYATTQNPISPGDNVYIPKKEGAFVLDNTTGKEHIYIFSSLSKIEFFENDTPLHRKDLIKIKKMGVAYVREKRSLNKITSSPNIKEITKIMNARHAKGIFSYDVWFWHD